MRFVILGVLAATATAHAAPMLQIAQGAAQPIAPAEPGCDCVVPTIVAHAVNVLVLGGALADGNDVRVVQPLLGLAVSGRIAKGHVALAGWLVDRRANHDGVFVVTGDVKPVFLTATPADVAAIRAVVARVESLEGVRKATTKLEVGLVDLDGDGKADVASTYGCKVWGDGACQVPGQFLLVHRPAGWTLLE